MGELLDLFLDFERKLLGLLRDMILRPENVARDILGKTGIYLGAFKFYTFATSLWVLLFHLGNRYFRFFDENFILPERLNEFLKSEQDFAFFIGPFVGLVEFLIPFATLNWLLFKKRNLTWLNHITLNIYIGAMILLYGVILFTLAFTLNNFGFDLNFLAVLFFVIVPLTYFGYVYTRIFGKARIVSFLKPVVTACTIGYLSVSLLLDQPIHEMLHRKILYGKFSRYDLGPDSMLSYCYHFNDTLYLEQPDYNRFPATQFPGLAAFTNSFVAARYERKTGRYSYVFADVEDPSARVDITTPGSGIAYKYFSLVQLDSPRTHFIMQNFAESVFSDTLHLTVIEKTGRTSTHSFSDHISILSKFVRKGQTLLFSGNSRTRREPVIGEMTAAADSIIYSTVVDKPDFFIDDMKADVHGDDPEVQYIISNTQKEGLKEISWVKGVLAAGVFRKTGELSIYKNTFNPARNYYRGFLHKGKLMKVNDSVSVAGFQIMTDSSFAINLTRINTHKSSQEWNSVITLPADMIYNDEMLVDGNNIFLMGRAVSVFPKSFALLYEQLPYVVKVDLSTGNQREFHVLPISAESGYFDGTQPEAIYSASSSAYQDAQFIHWNINGSHQYTIRKTDL